MIRNVLLNLIYAVSRFYFAKCIGIPELNLLFFML